MVSDVVRARSARFVEAIARLFAHAGLTPNGVTLLGLMLTAGVAVILAMGQTRLAGVLLIIAVGADAIDGTMARSTGTVTRFGAFLDSCVDRWAEVLIYGALVWLFLKAREDTGVLLATAAMAMSLLVSYTRARAEGVGIVCREGLLTRFERLVILIAGLVLQQVVISLWIISLLAGFTALQRIWITWQADHAT
jgi:CDP-diacylglycerol---glycerol-3-phosphate 3-phosphatidyltransferase